MFAFQVDMFGRRVDETGLHDVTSGTGGRGSALIGRNGSLYGTASQVRANDLALSGRSRRN